MKTVAHLLLGLALVATAGAPAHAANCVPFQGIQHCPLGQSSLQATQGSLTVSNPGGSLGGVKSTFAGGATLWSAQLGFQNGIDHPTQMTAIAGGEAVSRLQMDPVANRYRMRATFTGNSKNPTYSALIYHKGVLQASAGGLDASESSSLKSVLPTPGDIIIFDEPPFDWPIPWPPWPPRPTDFGIGPFGECFWDTSWSYDVTISLNGQQVVADQIRLVEEVQGAGQYPYLQFEGIAIRSTMPQFTILSESISNGF